MQFISLLWGRVRSLLNRDGAANCGKQSSSHPWEQPHSTASPGLPWAAEHWAANRLPSSPLAPVLSSAHWLPISVTPSHLTTNKRVSLLSTQTLSCRSDGLTSESNELLCQPQLCAEWASLRASSPSFSPGHSWQQAHRVLIVTDCEMPRSCDNPLLWLFFISFETIENVACLYSEAVVRESHLITKLKATTAH